MPSAVALLALLAVTACGDRGLPRAFNDARDRWQAKAPSNYHFTLLWYGQDGQHQTEITVTGGHVTSPSPGPSAGRFGSEVGTIDQMFQSLERDLRTADDVTATYDPTWGFPTSVRVDVNMSGQDDEFGYGVSAFAASSG